MSGSTGAGGALDPALLEIVVCPDCHGDLEARPSAAAATELACTSCGLVYPVVDAIPVLLVDEAHRP